MELLVDVLTQMARLSTPKIVSEIISKAAIRIDEEVRQKHMRSFVDIQLEKIKEMQNSAQQDLQSVTS